MLVLQERCPELVPQDIPHKKIPARLPEEMILQEIPDEEGSLGCRALGTEALTGGSGEGVTGSIKLR